MDTADSAGHADRAARADARPVLVVCGLAFEAAIAAGPDVVTACGPRAARLAAHLLQDAQDWAGVISFGCAGALDPDLPPGACVLATGVRTGQAVLPADPAWLHALSARLPGTRQGCLAGMDVPLAAGADKMRLWRDSGACAVDMESHVAALAARRHGLPFAACRVVLDPAWRDVPSCALAGMREDGGSALWPLLRALAASPHELGPLCALARDAWHAQRALREVRARLGPKLAAP